MPQSFGNTQMIEKFKKAQKSENLKAFNLGEGRFNKFRKGIFNKKLF